jgi:hypothetical protein
MDLVAQGPEDVYIKGTNSIWRYNHKPFTKTSLCRVYIPLKFSTYGCYFTNNLRRFDLIRKISLHVDFLKNGNIVNENVLDKYMIYKVINKMEIIIDGNTIETITGYQMQMISLMKNDEVQNILNENNIIDIPFSFSNHRHNVFPMISIVGNIIINIYINDKILEDEFISIRPRLYASGVYLDSDERRDFAQRRQDNLYSYYHKVSEFPVREDNDILCKLDTRHLTKAIFFTLHDENGDIIEDLKTFNLQYNGSSHYRGKKRDCGLINRTESNINPHCPVFVIPFALEPFDDEQPTTYVNLGRIDVLSLKLTVGNKVKTARVWGNYWNILRIGEGSCCLMYS